MAIMGFIIVVAGRAFSDSTGMRIRSQNMLASAEEAGRAVAILKEDISQMGAKWGMPVAGDPFHEVPNVYQSLTGTIDSSSFTLTNDGDYDRLTFRKAVYDDDGVCRASVEVEWYVEGQKLMRSCTRRTVSPADPCPAQSDVPECPEEPIEMASGITEFRLYPSIPGVASGSGYADIASPVSYRVLARKCDASACDAIANIPNSGIFTLSGTTHFEHNASSVGKNRTEFFLATGIGTSIGDCESFPIDINEEYNISFNMLRPGGTSSLTCDYYDCMDNFQPGKDHLAIGLRNPSNGNPITNGPPDLLFYPPQAEEAGLAGKTVRSFDFSIPKNAQGVTADGKLNACVAITAAFYSPNVHKGTLQFSNFNVRRKIDRVYHFDTANVNSVSMAESPPTPTVAQKSQVKAFQLALGVEKGRAQTETNRTLATIPVPNNGIAGGN